MAMQDLRTLRTKAALTDDAFGGATIPGPTDRAGLFGNPVYAIYAFVVPMDASNPVPDDTNGTFTLTPIYLQDVDNDAVVDATDFAIRGARQILCTWYTLIEIPVRGRLGWSVDLRTFASNPTGATRARVYYLESSEGHPT